MKRKNINWLSKNVDSLDFFFIQFEMFRLNVIKKNLRSILFM